jgi:hypothetical protein
MLITGQHIQLYLVNLVSKLDDLHLLVQWTIFKSRTLQDIIMNDWTNDWVRTGHDNLTLAPWPSLIYCSFTFD